MFNRLKQWLTVDRVTVSIMIIALIALGGLIYYQVRPIRTVDIKVPVATDKASYYPGQEASGIFFGEVYYNGKVEVLREIYCKNYKGIIKTDEGADIFRGISRPIKLEGDTRVIGKIPMNAPIGANCVLQFANTYAISTPFGTRHITVTYYTQNFSIVTEGRRKQLDCEARGGSDCDKLNPQVSQENNQTSQNIAPTNGTNRQPLYEPQQPQQVTNNSTTNNTTNNNPAPVVEQPQEPVMPPEECIVNLLGLCIRL